MTQPTEHDVVWLTQEAFDKLQDELDHLRGPVREAVGRGFEDAVQHRPITGVAELVTDNPTE